MTGADSESVPVQRRLPSPILFASRKERFVAEQCPDTADETPATINLFYRPANSNPAGIRYKLRCEECRVQ